MASIEKLLDVSEEELKQIYQELEDIVLDRTKKLEESELKYQTIFNASPDIIYITDYYGKLLDANQEWIKKIGITKEQFPNVNILDFFVGDSSIGLKKAIKKIRSGEEVRGFEVKAKNIDGKLFDFEINSLPIEKDDRILLVVNIARDITKKKAIKQRLKDSEEKYRLISENANDLIRVLNDRFEFEYINEKVHQRVLGYKIEDLYGKTHLPFLHPEDRRNAVRSTVRNLNNGEGSYHARFLDKQGNYRWFEFSGKIFYDSNKDKKILSIARDIHERKLAELNLRESENKYRFISEKANDLIGVINKKLQLEYLNEHAFKKTLGYSKEDLIGKSALKLTHPKEMSRLSKALKDGFKKESELETELRFKHKDGRWMWFDSKGRSFKDKDGEVKAIIISRDITDRKLAEHKLKESEQKYKDLYNQLKFYKNLFAHDINNLLQLIRFSNELLSYHLPTPDKSEDMQELSENITRQVEKGAKLVSNVIKLTELEEEIIPIKSHMLCSALNNSLEFIKKSHNEQNLNISVESFGEEIHVRANEHLQEVFDNILMNAIKYNQNSIVDIKIRVSEEIVDNTKYIKIEFLDNGIGIPDDKKKLVFESGNRDLKGSKGMGLGLSIVKKIMDGYDGKIWVENRKKDDFTQGSNFIVLLREFL